jgi:hypothetical protein
MGEWSGIPGAGAGARRWKSAFAPRHGKGVEPRDNDDTPRQDQEQPTSEKSLPASPPAIVEGDQDSPETSVVQIGETYGSDAGTSGSELDMQAAASSQSTAQANASESSSSASASEDTADEARDTDSSETGSDQGSDAAAKTDDAGEERARQTREAAKQSGPLEAVLHMQAPEKIARTHPAMSPPPYVHHFDSYSLVKQLQDGGYTRNHSITVMKGVRMLLAQNLDVAQKSLVSKSDVENVSVSLSSSSFCASRIRVLFFL